MVLKIRGVPKSTCTRLVAVVCKEKEIPYEISIVDFATEIKSSEYKKFQPFGQIPYIDDDGFILYESRAISRYLIKKYPNQGTPDLIPTDLKQEALFEQASSIEHFNFTPSASSIVAEKVFKLMRGGKTDEARVAENLVTLNAKLDVYEVILSKQKYLAGENVTLADLAHLPYGSMLFVAGHGDVFTSRPNVTRWWNDISNRPSWLAVKDGA